MSIRVTAAIPAAGFRLHLTFSDGASGWIDLSNLAGTGVFKAWQDEPTWNAVTVDPRSGAPTWPGQIDLDPRQLHHEITGAALPGGQTRRASA